MGWHYSFKLDQNSVLPVSMMLTSPCLKFCQEHIENMDMTF
jgi:hypothetical protein